MREPGTTTEDIPRPKPAAEPLKHPDDAVLHRNGLVGFITGSALVVGAVICCLAFYIRSDGEVFVDHKGQVFAILGLMSAATLGAALLIVGAGCCLHAYTRTRTRELRADIDGILDAADRNRRNIAQLTGEVHDVTAALHQYGTDLGPVIHASPGTLAAVVLRLEDLEKTLGERLAGMERAIAKVPSYGQAVLEGMELRRNVVGSDE